MVTGASTANLAIILVDARTGVITQTKRHTFLISLLGIKHVVLAVNKMDLVDYNEEVFENICNDYKSFITRLDIPDIHFIPLSALKGDNIVDASVNMKWYQGKTMMSFLETVHVNSDRNFVDLRYPVQYVQRPSLDFRGFSAKVSSGVIRKGEEIMVLPSRKKSKVAKIITYDGEVDQAFPPQAVTVTLEDEIDISRGDMIVHPQNMPKVERHFEAMLVWMDEDTMDTGKQFFIKHTTNTTKARIDKVRYKIDVNTLRKDEVDSFSLNEIGRVVITTNKHLFFDPYKKNRNTGSFILIDPVTHNTCAVGMIIDRLSVSDLPSRITKVDEEKIINGHSLISKVEREKRLGQKGSSIWITGLHGAGKNELAYMLEKSLFDMGATIVLLDGKSVRFGLTRELDFTPGDRAEHFRRVAHMCRILNDQGVITICSFISPDENIRQQVGEIIGADKFNLIHIDADIESCKKNDPYKLYEKAESGEIKYMPGVDMEYQIPVNPDLKLVSADEENLEKIISYLSDNKIFPLE